MSDCLCALICMCCRAVLQPAQPGHEGDAVSHGICAECVPAYRAGMGLPPQRG